MCGIFGYVSNDTAKIDVNAFKILGVLNETRGAQSCGVMVDSDIFHGVTISDKLFRDFAKNIDIRPKQRPVLIGHTRKASSGVVNEHNAHPFGFGKNEVDKGFAFIGVHNGTLYNYEELAKANNVELTEETSLVNNVGIKINNTRRKIDSEVLLECIYQSKNFKVLSRYDGGAAIAIYIPDTNTVYLYSGESKNYSYSQTTEIERPLHVWIIDDNTFAFSSESTPLEVIGAKTKDVFQIETNTVYEIKDGNFAGAVKHVITRTSATNKKPVYQAPSRLPSTTTGSTNTFRTTSNVRPITSQGAKEGDQTCEKITYRDKNGEICVVSEPAKPTILVESRKRILYNTTSTCSILVSINDMRGRIYVDDFIYKRNNHSIISGIYVHIPGNGLHYITENNKEFIKRRNELLNRYFDLAEQIVVPLNNEENIVKSDRFVKITIDMLNPLYIYEGRLLRTELDYVAILSNPSIVRDGTVVNHMKLSYMTVHPVRNMQYLKDGDNSYYSKYVLDGDLIKESRIFCGLCFPASYEITNGFITRQTEINRYYLLGVDIQNKLEYDKQYSEFVKLKDLAKNQKALSFPRLLSNLKSYGIDLEPICPEESSDPDIKSIVSEIIIAYEDAVEESFNIRSNINEPKLANEILDIIETYTDIPYSDIIPDILKELNIRSRDNTILMQDQFTASSVFAFLTTTSNN